MDNLPPAMIPAVVESAGRGDGKTGGVVVVTDIRGRRYFGDHPEDSIGEVGDGGGRRVVFLEADEPTLIRRYKESRRPHPGARDGDVLAAIRDERRYFANLREKADLVVDTSNLSAAEIRARFKQLAETASGRLTVSLISFGFKHGAPLDVDMLLDVRFLPNPHYDPELRPLTGHDAPVRECGARSRRRPRVPRPFAGHAHLPHPPLRRRRQELLHARHRMHRRQAPLRGDSRGVGPSPDTARRRPRGGFPRPSPGCGGRGAVVSPRFRTSPRKIW